MALDMLSELRQWPHLDKERLFADGMAFYRWAFLNVGDQEDMDIYQAEFALHHRTLMHDLPTSVQSAAFITWFVANGFHRLPLLKKPEPAEQDELERLLRTRFSSPCFRLPTTSRSDTYVVQWLFWKDSRPQDQPAPVAVDVSRWGRDFAQSLPAHCAINRNALATHCARFFDWCLSDDYTWDRLCDYHVQFARLFPELTREKIETNEWDAQFISWFVGCVLDKVGWPDERAS